MKQSEALFKEFFVSLESIKDPFERNALLAQVFGAKVGITMANLIKDGVIAMDDLAESATGVFTDETIRNAEKFNDMMNRLNRKILTPLRSKMIDIAAAYFTVAEGMGLIEADPVVQSLEEMNQAFTNSQVLILAYGNTLRTNKSLSKNEQKEIFALLKKEITLRDELGKKIQRINNVTALSTKSSFEVIMAALSGFETALGSVDNRLGKIAVKSMKSFEDAIVNGLKNGKLSFKSFADVVVTELIRVAVQQLVIKNLLNMFSMIPGLSGGGTNTKTSGSTFTRKGFDGGGYTGGGVRAGGLDGKGGFMAMVHPQETVIDHTKGQSTGGATVNFNISTVDAAGFDQLLASRKGLITQIINNAMNNQGRMGVV